MSVSYGGDSIVFADGSVQSGGWTGMRNRIINGAMVIDQRNAGASITPTTDGIYTLDRWKVRNGGAAGRFSVIQSSTSAANFSTSVLLTVTTTAAPSGTEFYGLEQDVEGYNMADFGWGTANAQSVTVSFQVRSSLTGTYCVSIRNSAADRSYVAEFTINAANTFETKTITIPAITTGTWLSTNGAGLLFVVCLGSGSTREGTAGSWQASNIVATSNQVDWINTASATFYITGVQLERGSTASSFEYRSYGSELALCQRYYEKSYNIGTVAGTSTNTAKGSLSVGAAFSQYLRWTQNYRVSKRADATFTIYSTTGASGNVRLNNASDLAVTIEDSGENASAIYVNRSWTLGDFVWWQWTALAEL